MTKYDEKSNSAALEYFGISGLAPGLIRVLQVSMSNPQIPKHRISLNVQPSNPEAPRFYCRHCVRLVSICWTPVGFPGALALGVNTTLDCPANVGDFARNMRGLGWWLSTVIGGGIIVGGPINFQPTPIFGVLPVPGPPNWLGGQIGLNIGAGACWAFVLEEFEGGPI